MTRTKGFFLLLNVLAFSMVGCSGGGKGTSGGALGEVPKTLFGGKKCRGRRCPGAAPSSAPSGSYFRPALSASKTDDSTGLPGFDTDSGRFRAAMGKGRPFGTSPRTFLKDPGATAEGAARVTRQRISGGGESKGLYQSHGGIKIPGGETLADYAGSITVVDFFATGCGMCPQSLENKIPQLIKEFGGKANFIGMHVDGVFGKRTPGWSEFVAANKANIPLVPARDAKKLSKDPLIKITGYPHLIVIDSEGRPAFTQTDDNDIAMFLRSYFEKRS